jgi:hypothetical protein
MNGMDQITNTYAGLLAQKPRSTSISADLVRDLLMDAGLTQTVQLDQARLKAIAEDIGVTSQLILEWASGTEPISWRDLSSLALATDKHPEFIRRLPVVRGVQGPWYITPSAIEDYCRIVQRDADDARDDLAQMAQETIQSSRIPRPGDNGSIRYRGPKPLRLVLVVRPASKIGEVPVLIAVHPTHSGFHATIKRGTTEGHNEEHYRNWLGAWIAKAFNAESSVGIGDETVVIGFDPELLKQAWSTYKLEVRTGISEAGLFLLNSVASWNGTAKRPVSEYNQIANAHRLAELNKHANEARVAASRILQASATHPAVLQLELSEESALRRIAEANGSSWHQVLNEYHNPLYVCGRKIYDSFMRR